LVETTATGKPITMTITNNVIKKGAKIYSVIGVTPTLLTTATADGSATISITDDPQIIIAITKPDAPTGVSATSGGNASTTVSWTAPSDGGSAITVYTATSNAGNSCTSATTSCSVTGLTNGTPYTFTVTATNSIGISDAKCQRLRQQHQQHQSLLFHQLLYLQLLHLQVLVAVEAEDQLMLSQLPRLIQQW
jgi:hypothetical protein